MLPPRAAALVRRLLEPHWPLAAQREWVLSCGEVQQEGGGGVRPGAAQEEDGGVRQRGSEDGSEGGGVQACVALPGLCNRMYVSAAEGEMRIALTVVSEEE